MKLLVVLSVVSYCLAMPTPTNNATETLYRMMEKMKDRLFSAQCVTENPTNDPTMTTWTPPMQCMWPNMHNMSTSIDQWVTMMGNTGCTVPSEGMVKMLKRVMAQRNYESSPIINKFPKTECGMCGRRIQCCPANSFLVQSYQSTACESAPCQVEPMTTENWNYMHEKYPEWNLPTTNEPCNFAAIMRESMMHSKVFPFMRTMYMQMVGSEMPTMNCQMVENMCACCCGGFMYQAGSCVPMQMTTMMPGMTTTVNTMTPGVTTTMNTMTTGMMTTMTTMMPEMTTTTMTMVEGTTTTMMPIVETTMEETTVQTTTVRPVHLTTTPKTLFNVDAEMQHEEHVGHMRKRRDTTVQKDDSEESSEEKEEVEELAEKVAEEIVAHEGEGGAEDLVAEVIAEEIKAKTTCPMEKMTTPLPTEMITTEEPAEATTLKPTEGTTIKLTEAWTEPTTMKPTEAWIEPTTMKATEAIPIKPINATITKPINLENMEKTETTMPKVETPAMKEIEKPAIKE